MTTSDAPPVDRHRRHVELAATVLLALAAVATAWSSYQAARWNGEQAIAASRANAARISSSSSASLAESQTQVDIATFIQWVNATAEGKTDVAEFYRQRFRPEFTPAFDAWLATMPLKNADAPPTPFAMPEYQLAAKADSQRYADQAEVQSAIVRRNVQRATDYVLAVVLFAVALFFAGMSTKLATPSLRLALVVIGAVILVGTAAWVATFPISISV
jgi:hypothetical protein